MKKVNFNSTQKFSRESLSEIASKAPLYNTFLRLKQIDPIIGYEVIIKPL